MYTDPEAKNSETFLPKHVTMPTFCPNPINGEPFFCFCLFFVEISQKIFEIFVGSLKPFVSTVE